MGMDISSVLMYGVDYEDLSDLEELDDLLDAGDLDSASPHYDAPRDSWFVGVAIQGYEGGESEMIAAIRSAKAEFERLCGKREASIQACANVW